MSANQCAEQVRCHEIDSTLARFRHKYLICHQPYSKTTRTFSSPFVLLPSVMQKSVWSGYGPECLLCLILGRSDRGGQGCAIAMETEPRRVAEQRSSGRGGGRRPCSRQGQAPGRAVDCSVDDSAITPFNLCNCAPVNVTPPALPGLATKRTGHSRETRLCYQR